MASEQQVSVSLNWELGLAGKRTDVLAEPLCYFSDPLQVSNTCQSATRVRLCDQKDLCEKS